MYTNSIKDDNDIKFYKVLCFQELIQCFLNQENQISILNYNHVQSLIINVKS